ncbi:hypothetical protein ACFQE2_16230 [Methylophaga thalassica]|uniref:hypothetical protein n=1 Tax=Methylophaga thalassica TaxID=40223 RepID=UPI00360FE620
MDDIEKAISSGVAHDEIVAILNKNGFDLSIKSFRNALYLARKKPLVSQRLDSLHQFGQQLKNRFHHKRTLARKLMKLI